jgi:hypothetical protein
MVRYVQGSREHGALEMDKVKPPRDPEKEWDGLSDPLAVNQSTVKRALYGLHSTVVLGKLFRNQRPDVQLDDWISMSLCLSRTLHMACRVLHAAIRWPPGTSTVSDERATCSGNKGTGDENAGGANCVDSRSAMHRAFKMTCGRIAASLRVKAS